MIGIRPLYCATTYDGNNRNTYTAIAKQNGKERDKYESAILFIVTHLRVCHIAAVTEKVMEYY